MKKLMVIAVALSVVAMSSMAFAQAEQYDFGIFGDAAGTQTTLAAAGFAPFFFYVVGFNLDGQVKGFEVSVAIDPTFTVLGRVLAGPAPINLGDSPDEYIVGTGGCVDAGTGGFVLVEYNAGYFAGPVAPNDVAVCAAGTTPSSFPGGVPGYLQCDGTLVPAGVATNGGMNYPNGCLILNATMDAPVATETASFGDIKARF